jgi:transposase
MAVALAAVKRFGVSTKRTHLDSSSFCVQGEYLNSQPQSNAVDIEAQGQSRELKDSPKVVAEDSADPVPIEITHGYSRDHRPDLKQFTLSLITSGDGDVPLYLRVGNGNDADKAVFTEVIAEFKQQWKAAEPEVFVADSALYSEANLEALGKTPWISRVPATIAEAQQLMQTLPQEMFASSSLDNYAIAEVCSLYAGVPQRWLVVQSQKRKQADLKQLNRRVETVKTEKVKALKELSTHPFACEADALDAANAFAQKLSYHRLDGIEILKTPHYQKPGRPGKDDLPKRFTYHVQATLILNESALEPYRNQAGRFILATNLLNDELWPNEVILQEYKNQQSCERGFRFLKDPLFFVSRVFVKSPRRVAALAMLMGLCLLVYSIGQRQLRQALEAANETIPDQRAQPTARPTLRWVMQSFQSVHLVWVDGKKWAIKLNDSQSQILRFLGSACRKYYFLC